jgi:hypothetical protein
VIPYALTYSVIASEAKQSREKTQAPQDRLGWIAAALKRLAMTRAQLMSARMGVTRSCDDIRQRSLFSFRSGVSPFDLGQDCRLIRQRGIPTQLQSRQDRMSD